MDFIAYQYNKKFKRHNPIISIGIHLYRLHLYRLHSNPNNWNEINNNKNIIRFSLSYFTVLSSQNQSKIFKFTRQKDFWTFRFNLSKRVKCNNKVKIHFISSIKYLKIIFSIKNNLKSTSNLLLELYGNARIKETLNLVYQASYYMNTLLTWFWLVFCMYVIEINLSYLLIILYVDIFFIDIIQILLYLNYQKI